MPLATFQLPLNGLSDEVRALLTLLQNAVHAVERACWQAGRNLFLVNPMSAHEPRIDDITNCYKPHFCRYHLLHSSRYLISSKTSERESDMTKIGSKFITHNGQRVGVNYFTGPWIGIDQATIKIRPRKAHSFPVGFHEAFLIENNSDLMTDYFERDCIEVLPDHPLYEQIKAAAHA